MNSVDPIPGDPSSIQSQLRSLRNDMTAIRSELYAMLNIVWLYVLILFSFSLTGEKASWGSAAMLLGTIGMTVYCTYRNVQIRRSCQRAEATDNVSSNDR